MTLKNCKVGKNYYVENIVLPEALKRRLHILGLTRGTEISVLRKKRCDTMIIKVRGVRYALGGDAAGGIYVKGDKENG